MSWLQGKFLGLDEPVVPLLPNSDYQSVSVSAFDYIISADVASDVVCQEQ